MGEEESKTEPAAPPAFWRRKPVLLGAAAVVVVAVVSINGLYATAESYVQGTQATIAIDIRTGQKLWERNYGVWPEKIVDDVVVGQVSKRMPGSGLAPELTDGTVMALDLATGHPRWELSKRYTFSQIVAVAGDAILVHGQSDDGKRDFVVLDAGTGREVAKFPGKDVAGCDSDGQTLIACLHQNVNSGNSAFEVNTYDVADRTVTTTVSGTGLGFRLWDVWANRVEVVEHKGEDALNYTMDKHGNRIDKDPPGGIAAVTADRAILFTKGEGGQTNTVVAVYEVLS